MKGKYNIKAGFTLIEIIVVITIISIVTFSVSEIDFSRLSARQKQQIFVNNIISNLETVRNFSFSGKGIGPTLVTPDSWRIDISTTNSGSFITTYSGSINGSYTPTSFTSPDSGYEILNIRCRNLNSSTIENLLTSETGSLHFTKGNISISGCSDTSLKILEFDTKFFDFESTIEINSINGVIQQK